MNALVGIVMGSRSDEPVMKHADETLRGLGVEVDMRILSAHRTPEALRDWVVEAERRGVRVFICGAGAAAHLAGAVAAITTRPVIGVPLVAPNAVANGLDALLSTVQMPRGIPVATVAIGNAENAALLAVAILALSDPALAGRLAEYRADQTRAVLDDPSNATG